MGREGGKARGRESDQGGVGGSELFTPACTLTQSFPSPSAREEGKEGGRAGGKKAFSHLCPYPPTVFAPDPRGVAGLVDRLP